MALHPVISKFRKSRIARLLDNLYSEGAGQDGWVEGASNGAGSATKETDHLKLVLTGNTGAEGERTWVTNATVDLTEFATLFADWENVETDNNQRSHLIASTSKTGNHDTFDAEFEAANGFARTLDSVDVSGLTGAHHVRIHASEPGTLTASPSDLRVYRVWLED